VRGFFFAREEKARRHFLSALPPDPTREGVEAEGTRDETRDERRETRRVRTDANDARVSWSA
jgi:hypothetical protein